MPFMRETNRNIELNKETEPYVKCEIPTNQDRNKLKNYPNHMGKEKYSMNHGATIERMKNHLPEERKKGFEDALESGTDPKVRLIPKGEEFYRTGSTERGSYFTKDHPGSTRKERQENLQIYPGNDCKDLAKVRSTSPQTGIQSDIKPQPEWAKQAGYKAKPGMKQIYVPSESEKGALGDGRFEVVKKM
jgi:hypothetical protein